MTDILTQVFSNFTSLTDVKNDIRVCPPSPPRSTLVVGDHSTSRSILLLAAVTAASEMGMKVIFFTQTQIQKLPASLQRCVPSLSPESLKKIKFCYPGTMEELLLQLASLHESTNTSPTPPSLIIVDKLEGFLSGPAGAGSSSSGFHPGEQTCAAHLAALLGDTAAFLTQLLIERSSSAAPCRIIASLQPEVDKGPACAETSASDFILNVLDRYFQARCTLDKDRSYEAAAAGLQEVWHIYLSGTDMTEDSSTSGGEDRAGVAQEWRLSVFPDGLMEFKLV